MFGLSYLYNTGLEILYKVHLQVKGVKGASVLALHQQLDFCRGVVIDSLHCIFLGVVLQLLKLWFDKPYRKNQYSISNKVHIIYGSRLVLYSDGKLLNAFYII